MLNAMEIMNPNRKKGVKISIKLQFRISGWKMFFWDYFTVGMHKITARKRQIHDLAFELGGSLKLSQNCRSKLKNRV
jgi:hypothetical protein